jgi:hemerythrin-like metal-binding protein
MAVANWSTRFETGIGILDAQHQNLFEALNQLADSFRVGCSRDQVKDSLDALMKYTIDHFKTEEQYMRERGYPALGSHRAEHVQLVGKTQELQMKFAAGKPVTMDVTIFLADLLAHHIYQADLAMVAFLKEQHRT